MKPTRFFRRVLLTVAALVLLLSASGCGDGAGESSKEPSGEDKPLIGMSLDSFLIERWRRDRDVFVSTASELGAEVNVQIANGSASEQVAQIEYFIQKGVDAIVVVAVDCYGLSDIVKKAHDAGIYVISYDRLIMNADSDLYISFDNEMVGAMMAEALVANVPEGGNILSIAGSPTDQNVAQAQQDLVHDIGPVLQHLVDLQQHIPRRLVEAGKAGVEDTHDLHLQRHAARRNRDHRIAHLDTQPLGQAVADDQAVGGRTQILEPTVQHVRGVTS